MGVPGPHWLPGPRSHQPTSSRHPEGPRGIPLQFAPGHLQTLPGPGPSADSCRPRVMRQGQRGHLWDVTALAGPTDLCWLLPAAVF